MKMHILNQWVVQIFLSIHFLWFVFVLVSNFMATFKYFDVNNQWLLFFDERFVVSNFRSCLPFMNELRKLCLPPSVTGEVYCFPRRQPIFCFGRTCHVWFKRSLRVHSEIDPVCTTIFKRIAGLCFYPKSLVLYINGFVSTISTKYLKAFFKFGISFRIIGRKPKNIQTNSEKWILIKVNYFTYRWIRLDELYNLMESFFQISNYFLN